MATSNHIEILSNLKIYDDEPDYSSNSFNFDKYKEEIVKIIKDTLKIEKPFTICINGEWGSGKTSLIHRVYKKFVDEYSKNNESPVIWFDAWKYKMSDHVLALFQRITIEYGERR